MEGIFAAGDCRRGQSLIVWGIKLVLLIDVMAFSNFSLVRDEEQLPKSMHGSAVVLLGFQAPEASRLGFVLTRSLKLLLKHSKQLFAPPPTTLTPKTKALQVPA